MPQHSQPYRTRTHPRVFYSGVADRSFCQRIVTLDGLSHVLELYPVDTSPCPPVSQSVFHPVGCILSRPMGNPGRVFQRRESRIRPDLSHIRSSELRHLRQTMRPAPPILHPRSSDRTVARSAARCTTSNPTKPIEIRVILDSFYPLVSIISYFPCVSS